MSEARPSRFGKLKTERSLINDPSMRLCEVIGRITLSKWHPSVSGATWKIVVPLDLPALQGADSGRGEPFVLFDELGSGDGSLIAVSEGAEASAPFYPEQRPLDAYCAALLDTVEIDAAAAQGGGHAGS